jgi:hypothetical protein
LTVWGIAGLLALATGLRIGWALVHRQSLVSGAMLLALVSFTVLTALNWTPLSRLMDEVVGRPNSAGASSQLALIGSAAGSAVMITAVASTRPTSVSRRLAAGQYGLAALVAVVTVALFATGPRSPQVPPRDFLAAAEPAVAGLLPLLYAVLAMTMVSWCGVRLADPTRRGRALFVFSLGTAMLAAAAAVFLLQAASGAGPPGAGAVLMLGALAVVGVGSLLPLVEDWVTARRELALIEPLRLEMDRRHPDAGIGVRPRGPLAFRVAERLSVISDGLYLEATAAQPVSGDRLAAKPGPPPGIGAAEQADAIARWLLAGGGAPAAFPGSEWLRQPAGCSDRDWILQIARRYRDLAPTCG